MAEPEEIFARIEALLGASDGPLRGKRVLVSAGGTREPLDSVRYVGNRSSGRMGVALAEEARARGADVTLLAANLAVPAPAGVAVVETPTAADLEREALSRADADVVVMAAAVADYRAAAPSETKRPKDGSPWQIELEPTTDVLAAIGSGAPPRAGDRRVRRRRGRGRARARAARSGRPRAPTSSSSTTSSRADIGFDSEENEVVVVSANGDRAVAKAPKRAVAAAVLDEVERLLSSP